MEQKRLYKDRQHQMLCGVCAGFAEYLNLSLIHIFSADLRQMALVIILIKAGLSLDLADLKRVGRPAVLMSFLPALFEIAAFVLLAPALLGVDRLEAALLGAVLGAVSPACLLYTSRCV